MTNETPQSQEMQRLRTVINAVIREQGRKSVVLARAVKVNDSTLRAILAGRRTLTAHLARRLAAELGIPNAVIDHLSEPQQAA